MKKTITKSKIENKVKKSNHSNSIEPLSNSGTLFEYLSDEAFRFFPEKDAWRKRLCYTLHLWSLKNDSLEIQQFCDEYKMTYPSLLNMSHRYAEIGAAYAEAKRRIGVRRRLGALKNEFNAGVALKDMNRYDPEWIPLMKEYEDIKKDNQQTADKIVIIDRFPDSEDK